MPFTTELKFIDAAESRLGVRLPAAFRSHLLKSNGGEIEILELDWELAPVHDSSDQERSRRTALDIVHETKEARKWRGFPSEGVAVGEDGCGNYLVFLPSEKDKGTLDPMLYIWWHEGSELEPVGDPFSEIETGG